MLQELKENETVVRDPGSDPEVTYFQFDSHDRVINLKE
jgi:hypothetical protein